MKRSAMAIVLFISGLGFVMGISSSLAEEERENETPMEEIYKWLKSLIAENKEVLKRVKDGKSVLVPLNTKVPFGVIPRNALDKACAELATDPGSKQAVQEQLQDIMKNQGAYTKALEQLVQRQEADLKAVETRLKTMKGGSGGGPETAKSFTKALTKDVLQYIGETSAVRNGVTPGKGPEAAQAAGETQPGAAGTTNAPSGQPTPSTPASGETPATQAGKARGRGEVSEVPGPSQPMPVLGELLQNTPSKNDLQQNFAILVVWVGRDDDPSPVEGARVRVTAPAKGPPATTDASGVVRLLSTPGQARVEVDPPQGSDLQRWAGQATVKRGERLGLNVTLKSLSTHDWQGGAWEEKRGDKTSPVKLKRDGSSVTAVVREKEYKGFLKGNDLTLEFAYSNVAQLSHDDKTAGGAPPEVLELILNGEHPVCRYVLKVASETKMEGVCRDDWTFDWEKEVGKETYKYKNFKTTPPVEVIWTRVPDKGAVTR